MLRAVADTHAVIWYLYDDPRLSAVARRVFEGAVAAGDQIGLSAISLAEILYLGEKGRIQPEALGRVLEALDAPRAVLQALPLDQTIVAAMSTVDRNDVPDLPDRIIAATAKLYDVPLISRDRQIRLAAMETIW